MAVSLNTALGAFPITALAGTTYVPLAGGTMTGALTLPAGSAAAPALKVGAGETGLSSTGASNLTLSVNGTRIGYSGTTNFWFEAAVGFLNNTGAFRWGAGSNADPILRRFSDGGLFVTQASASGSCSLRIAGLYTDASNYELLALTTTAGTSVNITAETLGTGADNLDIVLTPAGTGAVQAKAGLIAGPAAVESVALAYGGEYGARMFSSAALRWTAGNISAGADVAIRRSAAGVLDVDSGTAATYRDLKLRNLLQTAYQEVTEMTAPTAPATNSVRIYAEDNGSGKTRLMALFATGAAQQIVIEP